MAQHREVLRVSGCTLARPLSAFEAVATDTPERRATSRNVTARGRETVLSVSVTLPLVTVRSRNPFHILVLLTHTKSPYSLSLYKSPLASWSSWPSQLPSANVQKMISEYFRPRYASASSRIGARRRRPMHAVLGHT